MKKLIILAFVALFFSACSNGVKTEQVEEKQRDSMDNVMLDENQRFVDSLEKAEATKDSLKNIKEIK